MPANPSVTAQFPSNVRKAEAKHLAGLVCAFRFHADGTPDELNVDRPIADGDGWLWLHFNLADAPRLPLPGCGHACSAAGADAARLRRRPSATARQRRLSLRHPCRPCLWLSGATEEIGFLHFALTESVFISSRRHQLNAVETTRKELRRGLKVQSPSALLEVICRTDDRVARPLYRRSCRSARPRRGTDPGRRAECRPAIGRQHPPPDRAAPSAIGDAALAHPSLRARH